MVAISVSKILIKDDTFSTYITKEVVVCFIAPLHSIILCSHIMDIFLKYGRLNYSQRVGQISAGNVIMSGFLETQIQTFLPIFKEIGQQHKTNLFRFV